MPEILKRLFGLKFHMRYEDDDFHNRPHIHVTYGEFEASIAIDEIEVLAGQLPVKKLKVAIKYITENQKELRTQWKRAVIGEPVEKINNVENN